MQENQIVTDLNSNLKSWQDIASIIGPTSYSIGSSSAFENIYGTIYLDTKLMYKKVFDDILYSMKKLPHIGIVFLR